MKKHETIEVRFEVLTDPVWTIPKRGKTSPVTIALRITHEGNEPVHFSTLDTIIITARTPEGRRLLMDGGRDGTVPAKPYSDPILPGKHLIIDRSAELVGTPDGILRGGGT